VEPCLLIPLSVAVLAALIVFWGYLHRGRELTRTEILDIARSSRMAAVWETIQWSKKVRSPGTLRDEKKQMNAAGGIHECDEPSQDFVAFAAALLKHKKHEWFVVGWASRGRVSRYWCNKGPDGTMVCPGLDPHQMARIAVDTQATVLYDLHNHPNSAPGMLDCSLPSEADLSHSRQLGEYLAARGLAYVAFVAERGIAHPYAVFVPDGWSPLSKHLKDVETAASLGLSSRRDLRADHEDRVMTLGVRVASHFVHNLGGSV